MRRVPLPAAPKELPAGARVVIGRPITRHVNNPPGRCGRVVRTSLYDPPPRVRPDPDNPKPPPKADPPRLFVVVRMDEPVYPQEECYKWADELDLLT